MTTEQTPAIAYRFQNGMLIVFDLSGQQVPEYQGIAEEMIPKLRKDFPECPVRPGVWGSNWGNDADTINRGNYG